MSGSDDYAKMLGALEKDAFEDEVCARLGNCVSDLQRIPRKPSGDAGLDGLSHGQTRAYCCYGPEQQPFKMNTRGLVSDITKKFRSDLRKLFELEHRGKSGLVQKPTPELKTILATGQRILNIYLVVNWFDSHRIIGPLNTSFNEYKAASSCTYVSPSAQLTIWGPKDLATLWAVDEHALFRAEHKALIAKVKDATVVTAPAPVPADFDAKFDDLRQRTPNTANVDKLAGHFRKAWGAALVLDNELAADVPSLHESLEQARTQAAVAARLKSMQAGTPEALIMNMRDEMNKLISQALGQRLGPLSAPVVDGEVARLIGECDLDWRR